MRYGIPSYRLPRDVVEGEVERIRSMGVEIVCGRTVDDLEATMRDEGFDAAFLAVGAQRGKHADIPAGDSARILDAVTLLHDTEEREAPELGRRVVIYGGGDTAMDAARTARRLGAEDAVVVYRRTRERMPANVEEVQDAVDEGVRLKWLSTIVGDGWRVPHHRADGARCRRLPPAHRRGRGAAGGLGDPGARAGGGPVAARRRPPRSRWPTGSSRSGTT